MRKQNQFWALGLVLSLLAGLLWMNQGCSGKVPPLSAVLSAALPPLPPNVVDDFEDGDLLVNKRLAKSLNGYWANATYAQTSMSFLVTSPSPANGSVNAMHLFGTFSDPGNSSYPAFQLQAYLTNDGSLFDASAFTGIQFDWNCPPADNTVQKFFCLAVNRTTPPGQGGGCTGSPIPCYDHYSAIMSNTVGWASQSVTFSAMANQYNNYGPILPSDLQEIVFLLWTNRSNNILGSYTADMWVDNVQFF